MLTVYDEDELRKLWQQAHALAEREFGKERLLFPVGTIFHEPDRNNEATAIALAPLREFERLCRKLPLAFQDARYDAALEQCRELREKIERKIRAPVT